MRLLLAGATGRMGGAIVRLLGEFPDLSLCGALASTASTSLGRDAGEWAGSATCGVRITSDLPSALSAAQVAVDFSNAAASPGILRACVQARVPLLIGTTGLPATLEAALTAASQVIPVLVAANTSLGVNLLLDLVRRAAHVLPAGFDIEILDVHHRDKLDAPSGTALALGRAAAEARGGDADPGASAARMSARAARSPGQIGYASVRGGDVVGDHEVLFLGDGERLVLRHSATDRNVFARGALCAARWLAKAPPGRYAMSDIFN